MQAVSSSINFIPIQIFLLILMWTESCRGTRDKLVDFLKLISFQLITDLTKFKQFMTAACYFLTDWPECLTDDPCKSLASLDCLLIEI